MAKNRTGFYNLTDEEVKLVLRAARESIEMKKSGWEVVEKGYARVEGEKTYYSTKVGPYHDVDRGVLWYGIYEPYGDDIKMMPFIEPYYTFEALESIERAMVNELEAREEYRKKLEEERLALLEKKRKRKEALKKLSDSLHSIIHGDEEGKSRRLRK